MDITKKIERFIDEDARSNNSRISGELGPGPGEKIMWKEFQKYWKMKFGGEMPSVKALKDPSSEVLRGWEQFKKGVRT